MAESDRMPAVRLTSVVRRDKEGAGTLDVLRGADLALYPGEAVALVAPSGAGKSTLLHCAGLLEKPDGGEIHVQGAATAAMGDAERTALRRTQIGFVYQFHYLLPEFSALENVSMPQRIAGLDRSEA
ncbi:MAG: ATP-binding cassette domain-containing protein, partial [Beijerinckiaceae bacterium]